MANKKADISAGLSKMAPPDGLFSNQVLKGAQELYKLRHVLDAQLMSGFQTPHSHRTLPPL